MTQRRISTTLGALILAAGFLMVGSLPTGLFAHDTYDSQRYDGRYVRQQGEHNGYDYGFRHGREDRHARIGYKYKSHEYREAMAGYNPRLGHRRDYQRGFRDGYRAGYDAGYNGRGGYRDRGWR